MSEMKNVRSIVAENPLLVLFLGACPALAVTTHVKSALVMGIAVLAIMVVTNLLMALLGKVLPTQAKLPACAIIVAGLVSILQMLMNAFLPEIYQILGVYLAVTAVNLVVFNRAEAAGKSGIGTALSDSFVTGVYFVIALVIMGAVREAFGFGTIAGTAIPVLESHKISLLTKAPGGFMVFSFLAAVISKICPAKNEALCEGYTCAAAGIAAVSPLTETEGE